MNGLRIALEPLAATIPAPIVATIVATVVALTAPACTDSPLPDVIDSTNGDAPTTPVARNNADPLSAPIPSVRLQRVFTSDSWRRPTQIVARPDDGDLLTIVEQGGRIQTVRRSTPREASTSFMDISERVNFGSNEEGLLSLCFHPSFAENGHFYVWYSAQRPRRAVLSRFKATASADGARVGDPSSEEVILEVAQPYWNHNGGTVLFGPDGMLYLSIGDGGSAGDPLNAGQDRSTLLGSIIRIDVDAKEGDAKEGDANGGDANGGHRKYAIPADNPFAGRSAGTAVERDDDASDARPEIWAWGLRNVWRMSFDRETGLLWAGDVGQNRWEEINVIVRGGNYGWRLREGARAYVRGGERRGDMIDPVIEYGRQEGLSVTGGHVYRGGAVPGWRGVYLYADYAYGTIWGARTDGDRVGPARRLLRQGGLLISSFGEALDGELYLCAFERTERGPGVIYRLSAGAVEIAR